MSFNNNRIYQFSYLDKYICMYKREKISYYVKFSHILHGLPTSVII